MEKHKKENKLIIIIISTLLIIGVTVFGIYFIMDNTVFSADEKPVVEDSAKPENSPEITPVVVIQEFINVSITDSSVRVTNIPKTYQYSVKTIDYSMVINIAGRNIENNKLLLENTDGIIKSANVVTIGEDSIELTISLNDYFNFNEQLTNNQLTIDFYQSANKNVFTYRNDTVRKYIILNNAKLSAESKENTKKYQEDISEDGLIYKMIIDSNLVPKLVDEKLIYNDEYLNYIDITSEGSKKIIEFNAKKALVYYPNTRDYDATLTLIEPDISSNIIVVDAGHGGVDSGVAYEGRIEKDVVLPIALKTYEVLTKAGYDCYLIREDDEYVGLNERIDIANILNASMFLNIHANAFSDDTSVHGVLVMHKDDEAFAKQVLDGILDATNAKNMYTVQTDGMLVTNKAMMPALIIETGFVTNTEEWNTLNDEEYQYKIAEGIKNGVIEYLSKN